MTEKNPLAHPSAPTIGQVEDTSWIEMAEGTTPEAKEGPSAEATLAAAEEKFAVSSEPPAPSVEDTAAIAALHEKMGIVGENTTAEQQEGEAEVDLDTLSEEELKSLHANESAERSRLNAELRDGYAQQADAIGAKMYEEFLDMKRADPYNRDEVLTAASNSLNSMHLTGTGTTRDQAFYDIVRNSRSIREKMSEGVRAEADALNEKIEETKEKVNNSYTRSNAISEALEARRGTK